VSRSISETLPDDALQRKVRPSNVVNAKLDPLAVPEIELGEAAMQMLFGAVLGERLRHAAQALDRRANDRLAQPLP
jgi:hypothetical protein